MKDPLLGSWWCSMVVEVTVRFERRVNVSQRAYLITRRSLHFTRPESR